MFTIEPTDDTMVTFERRFEHALEDISERSEKPYRISASIGSIVITPDADDTIEGIITRADEKMYAAKKSKKAGRE